MSNHPTQSCAPSSQGDGASSHPDRAHWTPARQRIFLAALLDSGSVAYAAGAAGMSRSSAHRLRARLAGTPFDRGWAQALALHARALADPFGAPPPARAASRDGNGAVAARP